MANTLVEDSPIPLLRREMLNSAQKMTPVRTSINHWRTSECHPSHGSGWQIAKTTFISTGYVCIILNDIFGMSKLSERWVQCGTLSRVFFYLIRVHAIHEHFSNIPPCRDGGTRGFWYERIPCWTQGILTLMAPHVVCLCSALFSVLLSWFVVIYLGPVLSYFVEVKNTSPWFYLI